MYSRAQVAYQRLADNFIKQGIDPKVGMALLGTSGAGALTGVGASAVDLVTGPDQFYNSGELPLNYMYSLLPMGGAAIGAGAAGGLMKGAFTMTPEQERAYVATELSNAKKNAVNRAKKIGTQAAINEMADIKNNAAARLQSRKKGRLNTARLAGSVLGQLAGLGIALPKLEDQPAVQTVSGIYYG